MNSILVIISFVIVAVTGRPQSASELAIGTKLTEQLYYSMGAPDLIPYNNPQEIDNAREETEGYGSKIDSVYDGLHKKTSNVFNPQPVVDNLQESEKFGNDGEKLQVVKNLIVGALSVGSNLLNSIVDAPGKITTSVITSANKVLNQIGGKVVGLQK